MKQRSAFPYWLLLVIFTLLYLLPLNGRMLWQPDETRYAEISREMLSSGDWVVPHLLGIRYFEKPVAGYWLNNLGQWLFSDSNFGVRFASVFSIGGSALLVLLLGLRMWGSRTTAAMAVLIYLSSLLVFSVGTYSALDPMLTLWLTATMTILYLASQATTVRGRAGYYLLLGAACAMGFMTKGFLALAIPVVAMLPVALLQKRLKSLLAYAPLALLSTLLLSLPWALQVFWREPDYWHYFFWVENVQRFAGDNAQHKAPFVYYLPVLIVGVLPWLGLLPGALLHGWRERRQQPELLFLLSWVLMPLLLLSIAKGKLPTYILPCMAPLALLMASYVREMPLRALRINAQLNGWFGLLIVAGLLLLASGLTPAPLLYGAQERGKLIIALLSFGAWALVGFYCWWQPQRRWFWAAACPVVLALVLGSVIPRSVEETKLPQPFIRANLLQLQDSRYLLSNQVGLATALAWELKRSDIQLLAGKGELTYGLAYPDAKDRFIAEGDFSEWLQQARRRGSVSVLLQADKASTWLMDLPEPDQQVRGDRLLLLQYRQVP